MIESEKALATANKIGAAVAKKFPKHTLYVRRTAEPNEKGFIEVSLRPEGGYYRDEITTAYSDEYFASADKTNIQDKARKILEDFKAAITAR